MIYEDYKKKIVLLLSDCRFPYESINLTNNLVDKINSITTLYVRTDKGPYFLFKALVLENKTYIDFDGPIRLEDFKRLNTKYLERIYNEIKF
jgi:hypothetical protein